MRSGYSVHICEQCEACGPSHNQPGAQGGGRASETVMQMWLCGSSRTKSKRLSGNSANNRQMPTNEHACEKRASSTNNVRLLRWQRRADNMHTNTSRKLCAKGNSRHCDNKKKQKKKLSFTLSYTFTCMLSHPMFLVLLVLALQK